MTKAQLKKERKRCLPNHSGKLTRTTDPEFWTQNNVSASKYYWSMRETLLLLQLCPLHLPHERLQTGLSKKHFEFQFIVDAKGAEYGLRQKSIKQFKWKIHHLIKNQGFYARMNDDK